MSIFETAGRTVRFISELGGKTGTGPEQRSIDLGAQLVKQAAGHNIYGMQYLLAAGADPNQVDRDGWTPLLWIVPEGEVGPVRMLLDYGANVNYKDRAGWTALMWAAHKGHADIASLLLEKGANINGKDNNGRTALMMASAKRHADAIMVLTEATKKSTGT